MTPGIFVIAISLVAVWAATSRQVDVSEVLDRYDAAQAKLVSFSAKGITTVEAIGQNSTSFSYTESLFHTDGARVHHQYSQWRRLSSKDTPRTASNGAQRAYLWDGRSSFEYRKEKDFDGRLFIAGNDDLRKGMVAIGYGGAPLMGIFHADHDPVGTILRDAGTISLRPQRELVGSSSCFVIDAVTDHGRYAVWIDPDHGYNVAKAEVHKKEGDMAWGKPLGWIGNVDNLALRGRKPEPYTSIHFSLENVVFRKIAGVWVPLEADYESTASRKGSTSTIKTHYHCTEMQLNPDFDRIGAFVPDIPNETRTYVLETQGITYKWQDGKPVPVVDQRFLNGLDRSLASISDHPGDSNQINKLAVTDVEDAEKTIPPSKVALNALGTETSSQSTPKSHVIWIVAGACITIGAGSIAIRNRIKRQ